jgi:CHAT domain-containing protein/tetratricopeptide (TPR) repeat protein
MRSADLHLTPQEMELLLFGPADPRNGDTGDASAHLSGCALCQSVAEKYRKADEILRNVGPRNKGQVNQNQSSAGPDCPEEDVWLSWAAGLLTDEEAVGYVAHAAACNWCAPLLKEAMEDLAFNITAEEHKALDQLPSASPEWQHQLAMRLAAQQGSTATADVVSRRASSASTDPSGVVPVSKAPEQEQRAATRLKLKSLGRRWWPKLVWAAAAAAVLVAACWFTWLKTREPDANQLLAEVYTEHRTIELRIPGAAFGPMKGERGGEGSRLNLPAFLDAEAEISHKLVDEPENAYFLELRGRAELLEWNYDQGIKTLQRAQKLAPDSLPLKIDLASAYFERAEHAEGSNRRIDYGYAIELLSQVVAKDPNNTLALFNRAIVFGRLPCDKNAIQDWQHYLSLDSQGEWADDARRRLSEVQARFNQKLKSLAEPLLTPFEIAQTPANDIIFNDDQIEDYQKKAITEWLPRAFTGSNTAGSGDVLIALNKLASIAKERHGDEWWSDLLNGSRGSLFVSAVQALATAVMANENGDYVQGRNSAHHAAQLFRDAANPAGKLRAQAEEVYSDHLLYEGQACLSLLHDMSGVIQQRRYTWLQAQMSLEESNCANWLGQYRIYHEAILRGKDQANRSHYTALYLRALGFQAQDAASMGDANRGFALAYEGLKSFWSNKVDLMKGYNLYTDMDTAADGLRLPYFQVAIWKEATALVDLGPDVLLQAMAHRWYANAAYLAHIPKLAKAESDKASSLFDKAPQTPATDKDRLDAEIWLAQLETRQGDLEQASNRLQKIQSLLAAAPNYVTESRFHDTWAEIRMQRKDPVGTQESLASAISLAERSLAFVNSENDRRQWAEQTQSTYRNLVEWKLRQGEPTAALELWEWYKGSYLRSGIEPDPCSLKSHERNVAFALHGTQLLPCPTLVSEQRRLLQAQTTVAYAIFRDGIAVWVYDDRDVYSQWVSTDIAAAQDLVSRFQGLCSDRTSDIRTLQATARSLYNLLIAPVETHFTSGRTIFFEPDEFLKAVPWDALIDRSGRYFTEKFATAVSPGLYTSMRLRPSVPISAETPALIVSVPVVSEEDLAPLKDVDAEAQDVAAEFSSARQLDGDSATLSSIFQQLKGMRDNGIFHFAGHAVTSVTRSGLVLKEQDPRTKKARLINADTFTAKPNDGLQLADHLQLAVLSSCPSGEEQVGASGTESLVEFLLHRGVPHVIASRWNVDSAQTAEFMKLFYARLLTGNDVANSMHAAQLAMASRPASAHPYYWSAFGLQGLK